MRGLSKSCNLSMSQKFTPDWPLLPWQRKLGNFNTKLANIRDRRECCTKQGVIKTADFNGAIKIYSRPTPVAMVIKWLFLKRKLAEARLCKKYSAEFCTDSPVAWPITLHGLLKIISLHFSIVLIVSMKFSTGGHSPPAWLFQNPRWPPRWPKYSANIYHW